MPSRSRRPPLAEYKAKRDFARTPEPAGGAAAEVSDGRGIFVVQRHRARRLHYDLRLEVGGVLASWAVPKGPTLDPAARHLAVHVEDHPMEYVDFEGVIPSGEYGGGDVIVWDHGTWAPSGTDDPEAAIRGGELHFDLWGEKLAGRFVLIRRDRDRGGRDQWLLLHKNDEHARPGWDPEDHPASVTSGRTNDEVAEAPEALWRSDLPAAEARVPVDTAGPSAGWPPASPEELAALDDLGEVDGDGWTVQGRRVALTGLDDEVLSGRAGERPLTGRDLIRYHAVVAPALSRYLADRAVDLRRYPGGSDEPGTWQRGVPGRAPGWLRTWRAPDGGGGGGRSGRYVVPDGVAALAWLANLGAVELYPWTSRVDRPGEPTWALLAIEPGDATAPDDLVTLARLHKAALDHLAVAGCPVLSGDRGIQVWVPVRAGYSFADTRAWAGTVARSIAATVPDLVAHDRHGRGAGLAHIDHTRNTPDRSVVTPYGVRARPGAPVAVPVTWDELDDPDLLPDRWTVRTVPDRLADAGDPLAALVGFAQDLPRL